MMEKLPIYRFEVKEDDDTQVTAVALVDYPAIEMNWQTFAAGKISFDFDDTLSTQRGQELAQSLIDKGSVIYIISASSDKAKMLPIADKLGIPHDRIFATGSNKAKVEKVKELGIAKHYDNNIDVVNELGMIGEKFLVEPNQNESEADFISRCISVEVGNGYEQEQASAMCYSKWSGKEKMSYQFKADKEKRIISGPLMVADLPIYRRDEQGEYYGLFKAEDIYNIRNKFFKNNNSKEVNQMHDPNQMVEGVYMIESFLIDSKRGIHSPNGYKLPDGSWFGSYKVDNQEVWDKFIKSGEFKGFSVEGVFNTVQIDSKPLDLIEQIIDIIKQIED